MPPLPSDDYARSSELDEVRRDVSILTTTVGRLDSGLMGDAKFPGLVPRMEKALSDLTEHVKTRDEDFTDRVVEAVKEVQRAAQANRVLGIIDAFREHTVAFISAIVGAIFSGVVVALLVAHIVPSAPPVLITAPSPSPTPITTSTPTPKLVVPTP